jgi:hypothetical protein
MQIGQSGNDSAETKNLAASAAGTPVYEFIAACGGGKRSTGYAMVTDLATNLKAEGYEAAIARVRRDGAEKSTVCLVSIDEDGNVHGLPKAVKDALGIE